MNLVAAFLLGVVVTALALPAFQWLRTRLRRYRHAVTLTENKVTTVSQVLHLSVQGSPTGVTVVDRTGRVILSNGQAHDMGIVHERTLTKEIAELVALTFEDQETHAVDFTAPKRRSGSRITTVRAVVKPLTLVDDRFVIIYATDESENVRMESARRDFVANVSHELKTPVGGMALLAEALTEASDDPEQVEYFGNRLQKEAHRLADMINELISLSKLQGAEALPDLEELAVDELMDEAVTRNKFAAENAGIDLRRGAKSDATVMGDRNLLTTAISNLISNAINYSPSAMPVTVSATRPGKDRVHIRVTDRGIGIAPEDQQRVFERFFRVDKARSRSTGGTGLGLAIVKHVAANHGGDIKVWSRLGTGSTFTLILPVVNADSEGLNEQEEILGPGVKPDVPLRSPGQSRVSVRRKDKAQ